MQYDFAPMLVMMPAVVVYIVMVRIGAMMPAVRVMIGYRAPVLNFA
jgi:hypothetical protein